MAWITLVVLIGWAIISPRCHALDQVSKKVIIPIGVYNEHLAPFQLALHEGQCPSVLEYPLDDNQVLVEFLILCEALQIGGLQPQFEFNKAPDYMRLVRSSGLSYIVMPGFAVWERDIDTALFYVSDPLLKPGEFSKGIYTTPANTTLLKIKSVEELRNYVVVSNSNWHHDKREIDCMGLKSINTLNPITMARMIEAGRGDFLLFPFHKAEDLSGRVGNIRLVPVPNMKVVFNDSLHFIVSKQHPQGLLVFQALQKGLKVLTTNGTVRNAYKRIGFFNPSVDSWQSYGCINESAKK